eukprot:TRINITY_DN81611_c0_g1_i1.p1 TRINITY_DN81611_c0_g1~~TRINITY_DN81611_c0_g1_i1.p1  ORF type:complete len:1286 (+),score=345.88 TRINITY_DN81611_c0_g1_i1:68-3925(+)
MRSAGTAPVAPSDGVFNLLDKNHDGVITRTEWNTAMTTAAATRMPPADAATVCSCGNVFKPDSMFCRKCGAKRPGVAGESDGSSSPSALRPGQKKKFPAHWGVPPLMQTRDYVIWADGYGAGSSTVGEWIQENMRSDAAQQVSPRTPAPASGGLDASSGRRPASAGSMTKPTSTAATSSSSAWARPAVGRAMSPPSSTATPRGASTPPGRSVTPPRNGVGAARGSSTGGLGWREPAATMQAMATTPVGDLSARSMPGEAQKFQKGMATTSGLDHYSSSISVQSSTTAGPHRSQRPSAASSRAASTGGGHYVPSGVLSTGEKRSGLFVHRGGQNSLATKLGATTAKKVAQIERLLLEELEQTLVLKAGFIASCLHNWRREALLQKAGRSFEEELHRTQTSFRRHVASLETGLQAEYQSAALRRKQRVRQQYALLMDKWREGDSKALRRVCLHAWKSDAQDFKARDMRRRKARTFGCILSRMADEQAAGLIHLAMGTWKEAMREAITTEMHQRTLERAALQWSEGNLVNLLKATWVAWRQRSQATHIVLSKLVGSTDRGCMILALRAWVDSWRQQKALKSPHEVVNQMGLRWAAQSDTACVRMCFQFWERDYRHSKNAKEADAKLKEYLDGEEMRRRAEEEGKRNAAKNAKDALHNSVMVCVKKWELGKTKGILVSVVQAWGKHSKERASKRRKANSTHAVVERFLLGKDKGRLHFTFTTWREDAKSVKAERQQEEAMAKKTKDLDKYLEDELAKGKAHYQHHLSKLEAKARQLNSVLGYSLSKFEAGDSKGMMVEAFRAWAKDCNASKRLAQKRQAVHTVVIQMVEGKERGTAHLCFLNWVAYLKDIQAEAEAHQARELAVHKWLQGERSGLLSMVWKDWSGLIKMKKEKEGVHIALLKAFVGEQKALLESSWQAWIGFMHLAQALAEQEAKHIEMVGRLQTKNEALASKAQDQLAKFSANLAGDGNSRVFMGIVFSNWRSHTRGAMAETMRMKFNQIREEQHRAEELLHTKHREMTLRALLKMGLADKSAMAKECFLCWAKLYEEERNQRLYDLEHNRVADKYKDYLIGQKMVHDAALLAADVLRAWLSAARVEQRERQEGQVQQELNEANAWLQQMEQQRAALEEQLWSAYKQIDQITETLQKELRTKEELAQELREANEKSRRTTFQQMPASPGMIGSHLDLSQRSMSGSRPGTPGGLPRRPATSVATWQAGSGAPRSSPLGTTTASMPTTNMWNEDSGEVFDAHAVLKNLSIGGALYNSGDTDGCSWDAALTTMREDGLLRS